MELLSARMIDRRLAELVRSERGVVVGFVIELADFSRRELHRELGYTSLFYYCVRQLGLSKSSAFRRCEAARLIARFPVIGDRLAAGSVSLRALVELRDVLSEENHVDVLARAEGMSQEEAQLLAVELRPRPVPRDVVRPVRIPIPIPAPVSHPVPVPIPIPPPSPAVAAQVPAAAEIPRSPEVVKPLTPELRRLNVTVSAEFMAELEQVRAALSHQIPDGNFEQAVREGFKLILERDRKRKALTNRPRAPSKTQGEKGLENNRYVPAAVKRVVWQRDKGRCTWPMGDGKPCGSTHRLELDHDLEVARGGKPTIDNMRLLCKSHNLMKAERRLGKAVMAKFRKGATRAPPPPQLVPAETAATSAAFRSSLSATGPPGSRAR